MPGLLVERKGNMESITKKNIEESGNLSEENDKENSQQSHYVRRSSRKSAKPEFLSPSFSSQSSKKSKSSSDNSSPLYSPPQAEKEPEENEQSSTEDSNADFSDNEVSFKKPAVPKSRGRKRKSANQGNAEETKKPRRGSGSNNKNSLTTGKKKTNEDENEEESLFDIVKGGRTALRAVLDDWIENYNQDKEGAMVDLIQFFVQCCGCKGIVTREMIEAEETVQAIRQLTETFKENTHEYPLIATGPASKKFKSNFSQFIELLISQCQNSIVYDEIMMDTVISWLIGLSDSQVRAFRHTSTFAGMKVVTALIEVALKVSVETDNTQRQLDSENKKAASKRSREQIEMLQRKREELRQNATDLQEMMTRIFAGIFVHRYRDVRPEIRSICIGEIGTWMKSYSSFFGISEQTYTKYVGWTLHDKVGEVRLKALRVLQGLYEKEEFASQLELFSNRFKDRIVSMTLDKESDVSVEAIKLVCLFYKYDLLEEDDAGQVEQLVFCDQKTVAHAAGEFLSMRLFYEEPESEAGSPTKSPKRGRKGNKEMLAKQSNIKNLIDFFLKTEIHNHAAYLVDSLWEHTDLLKNWGVITNMLLDINSQIELNDQEETALIEIMTAACKQSAFGHGPSGRAVKKAVNAKERKQLIDDRHNLSTHFMETLPHLLAKFEADVEKTTNLILIPQCFELEVYAEKRFIKHLEDLLQHIEDIVLRHGDSKLLDTCAKSMQYLYDNDLIIQQIAELARNRLIDQVVEKFQSSLACGIPAEIEDKEDPEYYSVVINLKRITAFYKAHDLRAWDLQKDLHGIIDQGAKETVDEEVLKLALSCMHTSILWSLVDLDPSQPSKPELKALKKRLNVFISQLDELVQYSSDVIKRESFVILSDLLIFFAKQLKNMAPLFNSLIYEADSSIQVRLRDYTMSRVFATVDDEDEFEDDEEDDSKTEELNEKRIILAAFCKLIAFNIFDMKLAAPIFAQLIRAYSGYSDIIKHTMSKTKEINPIAFTKTLLLSLQQAFEILREEQGGEIDKKSDGFQSLKDLARRFALLLGVNINSDSSRKCTLTLHRDGIIYSLRNIQMDESRQENVPLNLPFFEVLQELTYRLASQDRRGKHGVLPFLEEHASKYFDNTGDLWSPLFMYKNGLAAEEREVEAPTEGQQDGMQGVANTKTTGKAKKGAVGRGRAKKKLSMGKAPARPAQWMNAKNQQDPTETAASRLADNDSSEDEAAQTLQRRRKSNEKATPGKSSSTSSEMPANRDTPRPRGRPRKEPSFQTILEPDEDTEKSQAESPIGERSQENSSDADFENSKYPDASQVSWLSSQAANKGPQKPKRDYSGKSLTPGKRGRQSDTTDNDDEEIEEESSQENETEPQKVATEIPRKRQKREFPTGLFEDAEESPAQASSQESDLPTVW